ncbi:MAG: UDP-N-acetylmuramoyl-tripeptide--D-alanyl-D-alanine ligase [Rhodoluna sp.]
MIELSVASIASFIEGTVHGDGQAVITGSVETDSRLVKPGSLFVAKLGETTDGHLFAVAAQNAGAVAVVVEKLVSDVGIPQIVVKDSVLALGELAKHVLAEIRKKSKLKVIGITGSNGKTTTKNMLKEILSRSGQTIAPIESYNNEVGAPYSILQTTYETEYLVVELGAGGPGSIEYLTKICQPDIGVVLKVGLAHVGEFGGIESTAKIKSELAANLDSSATLILNADDSFVREMTKISKARNIWFGTSAESNYQVSNVSLSIQGTSFALQWPDGEVSNLNLQILGEHNAMNAAAAAAVADQLKLPRVQTIAALEAMKIAERWRMQLVNRADGITVINDAYNASPDSTKAALQTLAQLGKTGRRTIAVIGEMAELGDFSKEQHDAIGRIAVRLNIDQVIAVGPGAKLVHMGAEQEGSWAGESKYFESIDEAKAYLREMLMPGDLVLVKSSKSANLRYLGDELMEVSF